MIKFLTFAKRKPGMSMEDFMDYYNNKHIPLCYKHFPMLKNSLVRRNFMLHDQILMPAGFEGEHDYDVVTESIWPSREMFEAFIANAANEEIAAII